MHRNSSVYFVNREQVSSSEVKQLKGGANHSPPSSTKVKNTWNYASIPV